MRTALIGVDGPEDSVRAVRWFADFAQNAPTARAIPIDV